MHKQSVVHPCINIPLLLKETNQLFTQQTECLLNLFVKGKKPDPKRYMVYDSIHITFWETARLEGRKQVCGCSVWDGGDCLWRDSLGNCLG